MTALTLHRTLTAPPAQVWRALTEPAELAAWFWPPALGAQVRLDLRPAGPWSVVSPGRMAVRGDYTTVDEPRVLAFTWGWDGDDGQTAVRVELSAVDGGTALTLIHDQFIDGADRDNHVQGWSDCLDRLPAHLAGQPIG